MLNPQTQCCPNPDCRARGEVVQGNMRVHSQAEPRSRWTLCRQTFAAPTGTPCYRLRTAADLVTRVLTWLSHGCPTQAIVAAFGLDERTVAAWLARAGHHCQQVPQQLVQQGQVELQHVQADERWVTRVGRRVWMAMAMAVPSRLWLGGVSSPHRDVVLISTLVPWVRSCGRSLAIWVCVDGLASSVTACSRVFRHPVRTGRRGRPRVVEEPGWLLGQGVTRYGKRQVASVEHRVVHGTEAALAAVLAATHSGTGIRTAYSERLHATCRASLAPWVCRRRVPAGAPWKWQARTPAMAAGLTDHRWTMQDLLRSQVPLPVWVAPKRRGRPPKRAQQPVTAVAA